MRIQDGVAQFLEFNLGSSSTRRFQTILASHSLSSIPKLREKNCFLNMGWGWWFNCSKLLLEAGEVPLRDPDNIFLRLPSFLLDGNGIGCFRNWSKQQEQHWAQALWITRLNLNNSRLTSSVLPLLSGGIGPLSPRVPGSSSRTGSKGLYSITNFESCQSNLHLGMQVFDLFYALYSHTATLLVTYLSKSVFDTTVCLRSRSLDELLVDLPEVDKSDLG
ncbi:hypothetical protein Tco_1561045 [Tanacetum coccineum]